MAGKPEERELQASRVTRDRLRVLPAQPTAPAEQPVEAVTDRMELSPTLMGEVRCFFPNPITPSRRRVV